MDALWMLIGLAGNVAQVALLIGLAFVAATPIMVYQRFQAIKRERDQWEERFLRVSRELEVIKSRASPSP